MLALTVPDSSPRRTALILAAAAFVAHLAANPHYGFFRDELYFIVCGRHPDFGYVDQPPLVPLLSAATQVFGTSLLLLRAVPALCAAAAVYVTCGLARELGGGRFAQVLAALAVFLTPVLMSFGMKVTTDEIGLWAWPLAALAVLRVVRGADQRWWLVAGAALGVALESKYSAAFFALALVGGLLLVPQRRALASRWFAAGAALALAIALPSGVWQAAHGLPMWELLRNGQHGKNVWPGALGYLGQELLITNPFLAPLWIAGLAWLLIRPQARFLGYAFVLLIAQMIALHAKHYYPADAYPIPLAAGGVAVEAWTRGRRLVRGAIAVAVGAAGLVFVPLVLPVLSEPAFVAYEARLGAALHLDRKATATEHHAESALPPDWAEMHGWPELAATVGRVYAGLPPAERAHAALFAHNYGEAAALDVFGARYGLPPATSGHNQYWLWGPRGWDGSVVIDVGGELDEDRRNCRSAVLAAVSSPPYAIAYERDLGIVVCRGLRIPVAQLWPRERTYI